MNLNWYHIHIIIILIGRETARGHINPKNWKTIERLAEKHPYIVALLDESRNYSCTGSIINKRTVLTSGSCVSPEPKYVVIGLAVFREKPKNNNILDVAYTIVHEDYNFELKTADPNITKTHSNIGLVFVVKPLLQLFTPEAAIGNYYASELKDKRLMVVGYGLFTGSNLIGLQHQAYHQSPCSNPKWYYCICGIECSAYPKTYTGEFGKGAPVLMGREVVGVTVSSCGLLSMKTIHVINFNIFTVIGPYISWIDKTDSNAMITFRTRSNCCNKPESYISSML